MANITLEIEVEYEYVKGEWWEPVRSSNAEDQPDPPGVVIDSVMVCGVALPIAGGLDTILADLVLELVLEEREAVRR